tara:strand:- start:5029 stop:6057 length:1029 start_codon:yes stop_codon:yes gene_type:complete
MKLIRNNFLADKTIFIDGLWGCGKTMISSILSSFPKVELLTYIPEIERILELYYLNKITDDAAETMIKVFTDFKIYNLMMSRDINFRPSDLSSVFKSNQILKYLKRSMLPGDEKIPEKIFLDKPILNVATHHMLSDSLPVFKALEKRVVFFEVVRHPLYMIKQIYLNYENLIGDVRSFSLYVSKDNEIVPSYAHKWKDLYLKSNSMDRAIYYLDHFIKKTEKSKIKVLKPYKDQILTIPFEKFVLGPDNFLKNIEKFLGQTINSSVKKMLQKQKVPRKKISQGIDLEIYRRCGWEPSKKGLSEKKELEIRRNFVKEFSSASALKILDNLSTDYEKIYMKDIL